MKNHKTFSVKGTDFIIRMYIMSGLEINYLKTLAEKFDTQMKVAVGAIGIGKQYLDKDNNGIFFSWYYRAPNSCNCTEIVSQRLIAAGWEKVNN